MSPTYAAIADRALATLAKYGATITFDTSSGNVAAPLSGTVSIGTPSTMTSQAVQVPDDPEAIAALETRLGQTVRNPATLLVAASGLASDPAIDMAFTWGARRGVVKSCETLRPDGATAILHTVIASLA